MNDERPLLVPDQLEAGAVVPQCLDNMYLSDVTFAAATERRTTLLDPGILKMKEKETRTEYLRSLVYATQVVINRAFFINNPVVHRAFERSPENEPERRAFIGLLKTKAIVPYLWKERSFEDWPAFDKSEAGLRAISDLLHDVGTLPALRLSQRDDSNDLLTSNMAKRFDEYFTSLRKLDDLQTNIVASELFNATPGRERDLSVELLDRFRAKLDEVAKFAFERERGKPVTREQLYEEFVCEPGSKVAEGRFRRPQPGDFVLELKKLFDLRYNTNLPDFLGRYALAPIGLPGRSALCDDRLADGAIDASAVDDLLQNTRQSFMESAHKAMSLPLLGELSLEDVCEIRTFGTWEAFAQAQERILESPRDALGLLPQFSEAFEAFQSELSRWYYGKYKREASEQKYMTVVSIAISIGSKILAAKSGAGDIQKVLVGGAGELIPKRVKGLVAKLLVGIYDADRNEIDRNRSYSVDIWRSQEEVTREQLEALAKQFGSVSSGSGLANSGAVTHA